MSPHEQGPHPIGGVDLARLFKADAPARYTRLRALGPIHPARLHLGPESRVIVDHDLTPGALTRPAPVKDATPAAEDLAAAYYVLQKPSVGLGGQMPEADPPEHGRLRRLAATAFPAPHRRPRTARRAHRARSPRHPAAGRRDGPRRGVRRPLPATMLAQLLVH